MLVAEVQRDAHSKVGAALNSSSAAGITDVGDVQVALVALKSKPPELA
jgi:hypothetical protein